MASTLLQEIRSVVLTDVQKFRLIAQEAPKLSASDVKQVLEELSKSRRYLKVTINLANLCKNFDFVTQQLLNGNREICAAVLRFPWIYTTDNVADEKFLHNFLPQISYSAKMKLTYQLGSWLEDEKLGDDLWKVVRTFSLRLANRMLTGCSNELILREIETNKASLKDAQMLNILKKRFEGGVELLKTILEKEDNKVIYKNSLLWILKRDFMTGFELAVKHKQDISFGSKRTRTLLQRCEQSGDCNAVFEDQVVRYSSNLNRAALKRRAKDDLYLKIFIKNIVKDFPMDHYEYSVRPILGWLDHLTVIDKLRYLKTLYLEKYDKDFNEVPQHVFPEMLHLLSESEWLNIVQWKIENKDKFHVREYKTDDLFWTSMKPPKTAIEELKKLVFTEGASEKRGELYELMIMSATFAEDQDSLVEAMKFVVKKSRNELPTVRRDIISRLSTFYQNQKYVIDEMWPHVKELVELSLLYKEKQLWDIYELLFAVIKCRSPASRIDLNEFVDLIMRTHFLGDLWPYSLHSYLEKTKSLATQKKVIERMLEKQEVRFEKDSEWKEGQKSWRIFKTMRDGKHRVDMSHYPKCVELCRYLLTPEEKKDQWMNDKEDTIETAFYAIKDLLTEEELQRVPKKAISLEDIRKKLLTGETLLENEMDSLTENANSHRFFLLYLLHSSVVSNDAMRASLVEKCIKYVEQNKGHEKTAANLLAICLEPEDFQKRFEGCYPTETILNVEEIDSEVFDRQVAICYAVRLLKNRYIGLEMLSHFLHGDYLKNALGSFNVICAHSPTNMVLPYLESRLVNSPVSAQKHMIRWFFQLALSNAGSRLLEVLGNTRNGTIKLEVLKQLYLQVVNYGEEMWPALNTSLEAILPEDRQPQRYLMKAQSIDDSLGSNTSSFFQQLFAMTDHCEPQYISETSQLYSRAGRLLNILDVELTAQMFTKAMSLPLEHAGLTEYIVKFVLHDANEGRKTLFLSKFSELVSATDKKVRQNARVIVDNMCTEVIRKKSYHGEIHHGELLQTMISTLSPRIEMFLRAVVRIQLTLVLVEFVPPNMFDSEDQEKNGHAYLREFAAKALPVLVEWAEKVGMQVVPLLAQVLRSVLDDNSGECKCPMMKVVAAVKPGEDRITDLMVIYNLPSLDDVPEQDKHLLSSFIDVILQGSDTPCKIALNEELG